MNDQASFGPEFNRRGGGTYVHHYDCGGSPEELNDGSVVVLLPSEDPKASRFGFGATMSQSPAILALDHRPSTQIHGFATLSSHTEYFNHNLY